MFAKPKKIIFVGTDLKLLSAWSKGNECEVISSVSFLAALSLRFLPDLIVFENLKDVHILEIRRIEKLSRVPVLIIQETFKDLNNLNLISDFPRVMLLNLCIANNPDFILHLEKILLGRQEMQPPKISNTVKYAVLFINKNFSQNLTRQMISDQLGVNPDYLSRVFKTEIGIQLWSYVLIFRVEQAKFLLTFTGKSCVEIARECGFNDDVYFNKVFKKITGQAPGTFRKN